jgi:hypothetical protein
LAEGIVLLRIVFALAVVAALAGCPGDGARFTKKPVPVRAS